jgi:hypothetical protein
MAFHGIRASPAESLWTLEVLFPAPHDSKVKVVVGQSNTLVSFYPVLQGRNTRRL